MLQARFANPQRTAEAALHTAWHRRNGILYGGGEVRLPEAVNEAEGDFAVLSHRILAGHGFRTTPAAHRELAALTGREVISLELVDPRFYHLDVALTVLDDTCDHIAYYPAAFSEDSQALLAELFPDAIIATAADAYALRAELRQRRAATSSCPSGAVAPPRKRSPPPATWPISIDLSELLKGGGSVKCCTQEIRERHAFTFDAQGDPS